MLVSGRVWRVRISQSSCHEDINQTLCRAPNYLGQSALKRSWIQWEFEEKGGRFNRPLLFGRVALAANRPELRESITTLKPISVVKYESVSKHDLLKKFRIAFCALW